ncbi:hypothetical protein IWW57_000803 [Coemansia sp. S610]|nr:hypothetical protein IWW57_000803 [Coemansia sp. S610]
MGAVESLPTLSYDRSHHRLFGGGDRQSATSISGNKPVRSATICLSSCTTGDEGDLLGDKDQVKRASTGRGLFRASLRRYSYRTAGSWIHSKKSEGVAHRMPSAEDVRISSFTGSIDVVPQLSASMPHLPTHVESVRTQLPPMASGKKGGGPIVAAGESVLPTIDFAGGSVATFEGSGENASASGIAEFRRKLARRLSRSSRPRRGNVGSSLYKRTRASDAAGLRNVDAATGGGNRNKRALSVEAESHVAPGAARLAFSPDVDAESALAKGLGLLRIGESLNIPLVSGAPDEASTDSGSRLLSDSIDSLLEMRLFQAMDDTQPSGANEMTAEAPKTLSASSSMSSISTSASSSLTLSGDELHPTTQHPGGAEMLDYEDFMYLSACENRRPQSPAHDSVRTATSEDDGQKWWPRCILPAQNMQYMPKLSLMLASEDQPTGSRRSSEFMWDSPRLLRARSEGAIGKPTSNAVGIGRRVDFWDVLGRCPMRPTSSLALASLKDMAKSCADPSACVRRRSGCENSAGGGGYVAGLADSASDSDEESMPAHGMGLAPMQRGAGPLQHLRGNKPRTKRVLSEPMQYILYNSYLRYYGRPNEAQ